MASLKELKNRIGSVKNTQKITRAMQMVAAAKLRKAQEAAEASRPYSDRLNSVLSIWQTPCQTQQAAQSCLVGRREF